MEQKYIRIYAAMNSKPVVDQLKHQIKVAQGEETKNITYQSQHTFASQTAAQEAFGLSVKKLLDVTAWSALSSLAADFVLYDAKGEPKPGQYAAVGDYIQIKLPGPVPENWVRVTHNRNDEHRVEFTVHPSPSPGQEDGPEVRHFFHPQASSTFRVELSGTTLTAWEIGLHERINNQEPLAGNRAVINTVIAETGWLFYQKFQWKLLTDYLVHLDEEANE